MPRKMTKAEQQAFDAVEAAGPEAVERFTAMIEKGESFSIAAMLATRKPPGSGIDDRLVMANAPSVTEQFKGCPQMLAMYRANYKRKTGEDLPEDAVVYRSLVSEPGDPDFIVTHKHSLADVQRKAKLKNLQVEGAWENHPVQQAPQPQVVRINDQVMSRYKQEYREEDEYRDLPEKELEEAITADKAPVVTADDVMNAPRSIDEASKRVFGK